MQSQKKIEIIIIGLGYVGLPLSVAFGKEYQTAGFDISTKRISQLKAGKDVNKEVSPDELRQATHLTFTDNEKTISDAKFVVIAVPTPVDKANNPDLSPLINATEIVGRNLKKGMVVVYESTVFPGATEEVCLPILENLSGLKWKKDFNIGYSPERVNPGDKERKLSNIIKVVSGDTKETKKKLSRLYGKIITAGIYEATSIKVAEASKVIENTQRDLNIALMNELAIIFNKMAIDTNEVLSAANTKWNFMPFTPGLVGGHCIGVDPYYLTYKAELLGYHPQVILSGRQINDSMSKYVSEQTYKCIVKNFGALKLPVVNILGLAFKENCNDLRNTQIVQLIQELEYLGCEVFVNDPLVNPKIAKKMYGLNLVDWESLPLCHALIFAVPHDEYLEMNSDSIIAKIKNRGILFDIKSKLDHRNIKNTKLEIRKL